MPFIKPLTAASPLFAQLQRLILARSHLFFIGHIGSHSGLPGPLTAGIQKADLTTQIVTCYTLTQNPDPLQEVTQAYALHYLNSQTLRLKFGIT